MVVLLACLEVLPLDPATGCYPAGHGTQWRLHSELVYRSELEIVKEWMPTDRARV